MVGNSAALRRVHEQIQLVAPTRSTVLVTGESGTGKELVARDLHHYSTYNRGPFIALNCAAVPKDLAESELFGHAKGAFTGATDRRIGTFAAAQHGTLLIDEIGELELPLQAKLLRAIETHTFNPVGSNHEQTVDFRLIASTHRDLRSMVDDGRFRDDLYYRLCVVQIEIPPLREHKEDLPLLIAVFLPQFCKEHGRNLKKVSPEAMESLHCYHWPGNVRELRNVLESLVVLLRKDIIELEDLPLPIRGAQAIETMPRFELGMTLQDLERNAIQQYLLQTHGNRQQSAKLLGISTRTLHRKIVEYGLEDPLRLHRPAHDDRMAVVV
jgi:DNA-binding NtrC family response regulator